MKVGTDIIEINRIWRAIERFGEAFLRKVYTPFEIDWCESKKNQKYASYAARFAGKEAVVKALGSGFGILSFQDIEIRNHASGEPFVVVSPQAKAGQIEISLSHCKEYAVAFAIHLD